MAERNPEKKEFVLQHNEISQAKYTMPIVMRRLVALACARMRSQDLNDLTVSFSTREALEALEMDRGHKSYDMIREAVLNAADQKLILETRLPGGERITVYTWFTEVTYDGDENTVEMCFNPKLAPLLQEFRTAYERLELTAFARLRSIYAVRIFELLMSHRGHRGNGGNAPAEWFADYTIEELREKLCVPAEAYRETADFRKAVLNRSIKAIHTAELGIEISYQQYYRGNKISKLRFHCRDTTAERRVSEPPAQDPDTALIEANPEAWGEAQSQAKLELGETAGVFALQARAWELFTARSDLSRPRMKRPRGRPRKKAAAGGPE